MSQNHKARAASIVGFGIVIFACATLFVPARAAAQQTRTDRPPSPMERVRERQLRREAQLETGLMIEALKSESRRPVEEARPRLAYVQLKQDFEHLQTVHNQMMVMTFDNKVLDYKHISEASTEIRKRAARLKSNLPLPESEKAESQERPLKGSKELDQGQVKPALLALDDLIMSFVKNPIFQSAEVVDLQQSEKAMRDLEDIIKLSGKLKKYADKFTKAPKLL